MPRVLKAHRLRRVPGQEGLTCLQMQALPVAPGAAAAAQAPCQLFRPGLRVLAEQLQTCRQPVSALRSPVAEEPGAGESPSDVALGLSWPGVGRKMTAWLFAEAAQPLAQRDSQMVRTPSGVAPGTTHRGNRRLVVMRRGWNPRLRHAL